VSTYRERREARAERLEEWAKKREAKAEAAYESTRRIADQIPFGQPILVGHHSEGRARRDADRIDAGMRRSVEHAEKARDMASRAGGIRGQLDRSIYSDDPDAIPALRARIGELEAERDRIKAYNASCRKAAKTGGMGDRSLLTAAEVEDLMTLARVAAFQIKPGGGFPAYKLSNLNGNLKRNRDRLAELERVEAEQFCSSAPGSDDHGPGCDGPGNCVCSSEPGLIGCDVEGCGARFFLVPARQFPSLCVDHADEASRSVDGWTPENSL
jgi:hypothetical protein